MLDLTQNRPALKNFISTEVNRFCEVNPKVVVSCLALYCDPFGGWVFLNIDSLENSQRFAEEWADDEDEWAGGDEDGFFIGNCPDFDYFEFGRIDFDQWIEELESDSVLQVRWAGGKKSIDLEEDGDDALNHVFYEFLVSVMEELESEGTFSSVHRANGFRLGVQMLDSEYESFWPVE